MSTHPTIPDEDDLLAAELAFGLLDPDERAATEARAARDPAFAARLRSWQDQAVTMLDAGDVPPDPAVWDAIAARLPANEDRHTGHAPLRFWRAATLVFAAAALVLGVLAIERRPAPQPTVVAAAPRLVPPIVAVLGAKGRAVVTVSFDPASARLIVAPHELEIGARSAQLWVIPTGGTPQSLGVIAADEPSATHVPATAASLIAPGATLAISIEPPGGSPKALPTGPIILTGKTVEI